MICSGHRHSFPIRRRGLPTLTRFCRATTEAGSHRVSSPGENSGRFWADAAPSMGQRLGPSEPAFLAREIAKLSRCFDAGRSDSELQCPQEVDPLDSGWRRTSAARICCTVAR
jgi:hypothetical protein